MSRRRRTHNTTSSSSSRAGSNNRVEEELPPVLVNEDGSISFPFASLLVGILLTASGRWLWGIAIAVTGLTFAACHSAMDQMIDEEDKQSIRYNILSAENVLQELVSLEVSSSTCSGSSSSDDDSREWQKCRIHCIAGLEALAKKYGQQQLKKNKDNSNSDNHDDDELDLMCQQAAYIAYRLFSPNSNGVVTTDHNNNHHDDQVIAAALSLHALVAKNPMVRERHLLQADVYGLDLPIHCIRQSLKQQAHLETNPDREHQLAELQRKGCLLLGALGDGNADMATLIVQEDGLEAVFDSVHWYRYHEDVANWALWAIFILSYEHAPNKVRTIELGGVSLILQTMKHVPDSLEVARHGVAILFDLLRDNNEEHLDVWSIRKVALAGGLHSVMLEAMARFSNTIDIMMMGQEILAGTDYRGQVPAYMPHSQDVAT
ncbi:expressed unknown protein [Seminavis robusta]|uniref:Uncharacterized protein n=1 Tax=Seminavis robusta TaxID=568900 RepID=A0A9N8D7C5_9STRA|nr:expressed unknown protein [Seminavis robusta]|eukprot:Sro6_g005460.1 n/a (432) ;mRNA; f:193490-194785